MKKYDKEVKNMVQGFVTMATGDERYYKMALNLLRSYRYFTDKPYKFAIISDRENEYTKEFDDVVIIDGAQGSYMDKIRLLENCPYDENIFIDADCLAYADLNRYWDAFKGADDFSVFGKALPLDSAEGWFRREGTAEWQNEIHFVTHLHGVMYFIRPGKTCQDLLELSYKIIENYDHYSIPYFSKPADESVFALAIAIMDLKPTLRKPEYYIFLPVADYIVADISKGYLEYKTPKDPVTESGMLVHWANVNTGKALYKKEVLQLGYLSSGKEVDESEVQKKYEQWKSEDEKIEAAMKRSAAKEDMKSKIRGVFHSLRKH